MSEWLEITDGSFGDFDFHVSKPVGNKRQGASSMSTKEQRRLQIIERPGVDNAKIRDHGKGPGVHTGEIIFHGPNYLDQFKAFRKELNEGVEKTLTLPHLEESVVAFYQSMSYTSSIAEGEGISVSVEWLEVENSEVFGDVAIDENTTPVQLEDAKSIVDETVAEGTNVLLDNVFLDTVRKFESGISTVRSFVGAALTLEQAVRDRILQIDANIQDTFALITEATNRIQALFGAESPVTAGPQDFDIDPTSGLQVGDVNDPDDIPDPIDPLEEPGIEPDTGLEIRNIRTEAGAEILINQINAQLTTDRDQLKTDTEGNTQDVELNITKVIADLERFKFSFTQRSFKELIVPFDLSINELAFCNDIPIDNIEQLLKNNGNITDVLLIPKGTVVRI